ncbi:ABC transporter substrate-binding protein [Chamaesiphon minutus]|uniref:ABC-type branched-chain amino acid transport system, periplasmic component n=1 Tax=Chamaesiphon minutus (strain ATCC 27169 / PCC 6605) TaxID=1173020 RepID=K9UA33_CHAP6|nr:ABC transporter substrate-binding protein [Chamaesiphon minutus]AFY91478.1 ABC-type branched-chain amino acid transport system, periplasmic component [Chamaesiphon minutus PCC 6605]
MSHIRIIDLTSSNNLAPLSAKLTVAKIDDSGAIISREHPVAEGTLNIQPLIALNQQITAKFKTATSQDRYFGGIQLPKTMVQNVASDCDTLKVGIEQLRDSLDRTLEQKSWMKIREGLLRSLNGIPQSEPMRLVILTDNYDIQALSIEQTSFITNILAGEDRAVSVVFAPQELTRKLTWQKIPNILVVLGNQQGIQEPIHLQEIERYFRSPAIVTHLDKPSPSKVLETISDGHFDVIIMVGHSQMNDNGLDGKIGINELDSISIKQYTQSFKNSVRNGLKLVILAGCSSIGAARALASSTIGVPNVIAFRVPVHYRVLRLFFERLLHHWIVRAHSLETALTDTRGELINYDLHCPGTSILPILFTSPYAPPLKFPISSGSSWQKRLHNLVLQPLITIKFTGKKMKIPAIVFIGLLAATAWYWRSQSPKLEVACNSIQGDGISCGEEILLKEPNVSTQIHKQLGANAIAKGDYPQAIKFLNKAWDAKKDPETLIMLENAKLANRNLSIRTIAISIPASQSTPLDIPTGMLKSIAFAQQQWNADPSHSWKLQVVIADDKNDKHSVASLVQNLLKRDIFAGIGSYASEVTLVAKDIYNRQHTVLVSGTSTSTDLTSTGTDNFFFRVCSNNKVSGKEIANYLKAHKYTKIALFHTPGKTFSDSMTAALKANIQGSDIVSKFDFSPSGNASDVIKKAKASGAQAIVLIPDAYTSDAPERNRLLSIIEANNGELPIVGNEVVKDQTLFTRFSKQQLEKLVISLTWHPSFYQNNTIVLPNFWGDKANLDHRIAMNYDATQLVIQALDRVPIDLNIIDARRELQKIISNSTFTIPGITGEVSLTGSDRSQAINSLVTPKCDGTKCKDFKPAI